MERRKVCRYFERGSCKKDNCPFVHIKENRKTCNFYMEGNCRKGNSCNFYHPPKEEEKLANLKEELKNKVKEEKKQAKKEQISEQSDHEETQKVESIHKSSEQYEHQPEKEQLHEEAIQPLPKIEEKQEDELLKKMDKISYLLGINNQQSEESQAQAETKELQPKEMIQFTKVYPKKFVDVSKTPEMKEQIKQNQLKYFKDQKFLNLINRLQDPIEKEYYQIIRKFTDNFTPIEGDFFHFTVKIRPLLFEKQMSMHFEMKQDTIHIQVDGRKYPKERAVFTILNPSIPKDYKQKMLEFLYKYHANKSVFDTLKFMQNNFERLYKESHFKLQNEFYSRKELQKKIQQQIKKQRTKAEQLEPELKKKRKPKVPKDENPFVQVIRYQENQKVDHLSYNYEITVDSMVMQNCEYLVLQKMLVYLQCVCQQKIMFIFDGTNDRSLKVVMKLKCKKCHNLMIFGLQREVVQVRRDTLGWIGVNSGHLIDMGGIGFKIGCICNNEISKGRIMLPGQRANVNCHNCFQAVHLSYMGLKFYNQTLKTSQIRPDHQLPGKGACKHMKLTFRYYRYGCCGRCFSCDDCHILGSIVPHEKMKGLTMLCGFCAKEQNVADVCAFCHKQLVKGTQKTGHWEGGYGCRDQANLSRKDNKKYTGMTKKKDTKDK